VTRCTDVLTRRRSPVVRCAPAGAERRICSDDRRRWLSAMPAREPRREKRRRGSGDVYDVARGELSGGLQRNWPWA